jgi:hypothetical protein
VSDGRARPTFRQIIVDITKLRDYCLSPSHPHGRHKARVFRSRLGLQPTDAESLREALLDAVRNYPERLVHTKTDHHGRHFVLAFGMNTAVGTGIIRSIWIVPTGEEDVLRFISCYLQ